MKKLLFVLFSAAMIMSFPGSIFSTTSKSVIYQLGDPQDRITTHGDLESNDLRSGTESQPLEVYKSAYLIGVTWLSDINNLTVEVLNGQGQSVYHNRLNTSYGDQLLIYTTNWTKGHYTIYFTAENGRSMYGEFTITN